MEKLEIFFYNSLPEFCPITHFNLVVSEETTEALKTKYETDSIFEFKDNEVVITSPTEKGSFIIGVEAITASGQKGLKEFNIKFETPAADAIFNNKSPQLKGAENYQRYQVTVTAKEAEMYGDLINWSQVFHSPIIVDEEEDEVKF